MKKVITIIMLLCFCLNIMPNASFAAESLDEALGEVSIYNGGSELKYLSVNGAVRPMTYVYFSYVNRLGQTKEIPAYCVNPNDKGVAQVVKQGQSVKYSAADKASDPKIMGIIACGYPTRSLKELGLENAEEAYYATKTALWCYLLSSWDINKTAVNPNLSGTEKAAAERVLAAARDIYTRGTWWDKIYTPKLTVQADQEYAYPVTINGTEYLQQEVTVTSETWVEYYINVAFADETSVPQGTKIVDLNNKETNKITFQSTGNGYSGKFKILYPKELVNNSLNSSNNTSEGAVQLNFKGNVYQYAVYYAVCAETDKYGKIQNYICDTDPTAPINISFMSKYKTNASVDKSDEDKPSTDNPTTALEIIKVEKGTNKPLAGAIFEVKGPHGDVLGSFSTDTNGKITLPLTLSGTYVVTEKIAPKNYLLSKDNTQTVTVSYNQTATVTFANEPYGDLRIEKIDGVSGESLAGAKIEVKSLADGTTYSGTTQTGGSLPVSGRYCPRSEEDHVFLLSLQALPDSSGSSVRSHYPVHLSPHPKAGSAHGEAMPLRLKASVPVLLRIRRRVLSPYFQYHPAVSPQIPMHMPVSTPPRSLHLWLPVSHFAYFLQLFLKTLYFPVAHKRTDGVLPV